jgi:hypothetical protein
MKRKIGFYWVQKEEIAGLDTSSKWLVGFWDEEDGDWMIPGIAYLFKDKDFSAINETRILPPQ